ncbi:MAG: T9SS type A sorting domain-containing protein [Ignavibacteriae bacterium]|nr:T9SS type A sorting domain-containing protein [Ignavibacteriota bacterium]
MNTRNYYMLFCLMLIQTITSSNILRVPASYTTIQSAILAASNGDTVLVDNGLYAENINYRGRNVLVASRYIFTHNPFDIMNTVIFGGSPLHEDTASCVLFISGEDSTAVLEGFTLTGGLGTNWMDEHGAGIYVEGGGILIQYSSPTIKNNRIINNETIRVFPLGKSAGGAGIRVGDSKPHILNNYIASNKGMYGGGIVLNYSGGIVKNNVIANNTVYHAVPSATTHGGGGIWAVGPTPYPKILENNTIVGNSSAGAGSTIAGRGGGMIIAGVVELRNNIVWGNTQATGDQIWVSSTSTVTASYNNVEGGFTGTGNINQDPMFFDSDFHLADGSPCVDAGNPDGTFNDPADPATESLAQSYSKGTVRNDMGTFGGPGRTSEMVPMTLSSGTGGSIVPVPIPSLWFEMLYVPVGSNQTFIMLPDDNYIVQNVSVNGTPLGKISFYTFTDVRTEQSISASFERAYAITALAGEHGKVSPSGVVSVLDGENQTFTFVPERGYKVDSLLVDDVVAGSTSSYSFINVTSKHSLRVTFRFDSSYVASYRSFRPDSIAFDKDNFGKKGKIVKKKADNVEFKFALTAPKPVALSLKFTMKTTGAITRGVSKTDTIIYWNNLAQVTTPAVIDSGTIVQVDGIGFKGKFIKASYSWATLPKALKGNVPDSAYTQNLLRLPMPNRINVLSELFVQNAFNGPLLAGFPMPDNAKQFGWVSHAKYGDVLKSLYDKKVGVHLGTAKNFDMLSSSRPLVGMYKSLPPTKHNNKFFANLLALKVSIAASALQTTPAGFGELIFDDGTSNPLSGKMVNELAGLADSMLSARSIVSSFRSKTEYDATYGYANLDTVISNILSAFEGTVDTTDGGFSSSLSLKGTHRLLDVLFLKSNPSVSPAHIIPHQSSDKNVPEAFALYQNYPNPFNPSTVIRYKLKGTSLVTLHVFNVLGQEVATLLNREEMEEGEYELPFNAVNLTSGVYFYRINVESVDEDGMQSTTGGFTETKKLMFLR